MIKCDNATAEQQVFVEMNSVFSSESAAQSHGIMHALAIIKPKYRSVKIQIFGIH